MSDFLIIGGGIAGLSTGARLAALGSVTLLEAETSLGYHASGRSAALFEARYGAGSTIALNMASADEHRSRDVLSDRGLMLVGDKTQEAAFLRDAAAMQLQHLTMDEARAMVPILNPETVGFAAYDAEAWDIDTDKLLQSYARDLRSNGTIALGCRIDRIDRQAGLWTVHAGDRHWQGRVLVNAAGAWADQIAQLAEVAPIGLMPKRRSMARLPAPQGHDIRRWPMMLGVGETWYAKPDAGALIVSPAEEDDSPPMDAWADDMVIAEGLARYEAQVTAPVTRLLATWAGLRSFAPDRALVLGPEPSMPAFIWVAGQGGYGFQTAPAAARLVGDLVAGRVPALDKATVAALLPGRFR